MHWLFTSDHVAAQSMSGMRLILSPARCIRELRANKNSPVCMSTYIYMLASNVGQIEAKNFRALILYHAMIFVLVIK